MSEISRKHFLAMLLAGIGAATLGPFLAGCQEQQETQSIQPTPTQKILSTQTTAHPSATPGETTTGDPIKTSTSEAPTATAVKPDLVVARGGEPEELVQRALSALGGLQSFVPKGARVIIKPNICTSYHTYEFAATTNPWVVGALVRAAFEAGAKSVDVIDDPFGGSAEDAYKNSGIAEQVESAGGKMIFPTRLKYVTTDIPAGLDLKSWDIYQDILEADVLINVPIAKHHGLARLTLGMKNLMGVILERPAIHRNFGQRLADLASRIQPTLTVVDAVRILTANGPTGGDLNDVKKLDTLIVSPDFVAADSYAATLFGYQPEEIAYIKSAAAMGLGRSDLKQVRLAEI
jgi:uncharacterized protein (DUF362 family)